MSPKEGREGETPGEPEPESEGKASPSSPTPRISRLGGRDQEMFRVGVLLLLGIAAAWLLGRLAWPLAPGMVTAAVLGALAYPLHRRFEASLGRPNVAAFASTAALFFLLFLPVAGLSVLLVTELQDSARMVESEVGRMLEPDGPLQRWLGQVAGTMGMEPGELQQTLRSQVRQIASVLAGGTLGVISGIGGWLFQAGVALFTLFYVLRDGEGLVDTLRWLVPLEESMTRRLVRRSREITYATIVGMVAVAVAQGTLGGLAFWALGIPGAALWGALMALLSLLPVVGPPVVWLPAALILFGSGSVGRGLILVAVGTLLVGTVDNLLRALLVSERGQLHPLIVFLSVLGALVVFGPVGILLGPILFVVALSFVEVARLAIGPTRDEPHRGELLLERVTAGARHRGDAGRGREERG